MAGGLITKRNDPKNLRKKAELSGEFIQSTPSQSRHKINNLRGILGLNQTIEINQQQQELKAQGQEFFGQIFSLQKESQVLFKDRSQELEKAIERLKKEIQQLIKATNRLDHQVEKVALEPDAQANEYQLNFLDRVRTFLKNFRKNISEASIWLEVFEAKKRKKNFFWNQVKSRRGGGQYLFSGEHSASRSAA